jgi:hypothetical protein
MFGLIEGINLYDLYRYDMPEHNSTAQPLLASSPERYATTVIGGKEVTYKRGYTQKEYTPWLKNHPFISEVVLGDAVSDFLNTLLPYAFNLSQAQSVFN